MNNVYIYIYINIHISIHILSLNAGMESTLQSNTFLYFQQKRPFKSRPIQYRPNFGYRLGKFVATAAARMRFGYSSEHVCLVPQGRYWFLIGTRITIKHPVITVHASRGQKISTFKWSISITQKNVLNIEAKRFFEWYFPQGGYLCSLLYTIGIVSSGNICSDMRAVESANDRALLAFSYCFN